ncbi:hypothetical protein AVEN_53941-1 [Araneus ventricosus]|uniref:Uncharacterized protein n=1 Tax=Araneus ventricosus TaxID=182803 RepID=A0A4Y2QQV8_ARAVE|nr:hypothetical protein AVEN_53941-1 [Araneus ventricosus]
MTTAYDLTCNRSHTPRILRWILITRTTPELTPELAPPCPSSHATPTGGRLATTYDLACNRPHHGGSSVESGFERGTLRPEAETLPPGHYGPFFSYDIHCSS